MFSINLYALCSRPEKRGHQVHLPDDCRPYLSPIRKTNLFNLQVLWLQFEFLQENPKNDWMGILNHSRNIGSRMVTGDKVRLTFCNLCDCFNCFSIELKVYWVVDLTGNIQFHQSILIVQVWILYSWVVWRGWISSKKFSNYFVK